MLFQIDPLTRPTGQEIIQDLQPQLQLLEEASKTKITLRKVGHKRSLSEEEIVIRKSSPSEKARFHFKTTVMSIGQEMSIRDPHYKPALQNPFATLPKLREGKKILGSTRDLFRYGFKQDVIDINNNFWLQVF